MKTKIRGMWDDIVVSTNEVRTVDGEYNVINISIDDSDEFISLDTVQVINLIKALEEAIS
ncbi:hypothetical protein [Bacillus toyonensis]|uniref:hypothetical protein n=1 Tax=Bacillus toyonensis TaxID=155322 RepID=UPI00124E105B|nr:hypothetical protein [Bacillus toyonensis]KAB2380177.1 hypothetical protein F8507_27210 [Bacillus toyonensis]